MTEQTPPRDADELLAAAAALPIPEVPAAPQTPRQRRNVSLLAVAAGGLAVAVLALVLLVSGIGDQAEENSDELAQLQAEVARAEETRKALLSTIRDQRQLTRAVLRSNAQLAKRVEQLTQALLDAGLDVPAEPAELAGDREARREGRASSPPATPRQADQRDQRRRPPDDEPPEPRPRPGPSPSPEPPEEPDPVDEVLRCVEQPLRCADDLPG